MHTALKFESHERKIVRKTRGKRVIGKSVIDDDFQWNESFLNLK